MTDKRIADKTLGLAIHEDGDDHSANRVFPSSLAGPTPEVHRHRAAIRRSDFSLPVRGEPVATVLTPGDLRQTEPARWHQLTLSLRQFHRTRAQDTVPQQGQLVVFLLVFDSPEHNPG